MKNRLSRRDFVIGTGAVGGALLTGCDSAGTTSAAPGPLAQIYDAIVVGAGIAGMSAAQTLKAAGKNVLVLEARSRVGGRCNSDNTTFPGLAFDQGAQWFHQTYSINPLPQIATTRGVVLTPDTFPRAILDLVNGDGTGAQTAAMLLACGSAVDAAGDHARNGAPDVSMATATAALTGKYGYNIAAVANGSLRCGGAQSALSSVDYAIFSEVSPLPASSFPPGDDVLVKTGMGNFIASFAQGLNIVFNAPVSSISYGPSGVSIGSGTTTYRAKAAIVTTSIGVLQSGSLAFSPALPALHQNAINGLSMGLVDKYALAFSSNPWKPGVLGSAALAQNYNNFIIPPHDNPDLKMPIIFANAWETNAIVLLVGSQYALDLEAMGPAGAVNALLAFLSTPTMQQYIDVSSYTGVWANHPWGNDPYALGSYSGAKVGGAQGRVDLQTPVNGQIFFAGEGCHPQAHGSLHGGYMTGQNQAGNVLRMLSGSSDFRKVGV